MLCILIVALDLTSLPVTISDVLPWQRLTLNLALDLTLLFKSLLACKYWLVEERFGLALAASYTLSCS